MLRPVCDLVGSNSTRCLQYAAQPDKSAYLWIRTFETVSQRSTVCFARNYWLKAGFRAPFCLSLVICNKNFKFFFFCLFPKDSTQLTPLMIACSRGHDTVVDLLLRSDSVIVDRQSIVWFVSRNTKFSVEFFLLFAMTVPEKMPVPTLCDCDLFWSGRKLLCRWSWMDDYVLVATFLRPRRPSNQRNLLVAPVCSTLLTLLSLLCR